MESYYRIPLDNLLSRELAVQWFEGVAIVQGICRQILAEGSGERGFPSFDGVYVCANGTIEVEGTASRTESVATAGHALNQMLGEDAPVRLRLVASQATAGETGYPTLQEFSDAVAYFERPDSEGILRKLHDRAWEAELASDSHPDFVSWDETPELVDTPEEVARPEEVATPEQAATPEQPTPLQQATLQPPTLPQQAVIPQQAAVPQQPATPQQTPKPPQPAGSQQPATPQQRPKPHPASEQAPPATKKDRRKLELLAGLAASLVVVSAGVWRLTRGGDGTTGSVVETVQNVVRSTLARVAPSEPAKADAKPESTASSAAPPRMRAHRRLPSEKSGNATGDRTQRGGGNSRVAAMQALIPVPPLPMTMWSRPEVPEDVEQAGPQGRTLYSARDSEVVPPQSVYPKLPPAPPSGFSVPGQTILEMVIGTNGVVERVKLRSDPRNIHEFMLVSAAKAWQFEPARLHGTPVRYLHTVVLTLQ